MTPWLRRIVAIAALAVFVLWLGLGIVAMSTEPGDNRAYAETWRQAPISELLAAQDDKAQALPRSDGVAGMVYRYHIGPWRGLKGRIYPGTIVGILSGNPRMHSGLNYTAPVGAYCDIDFVSNEAGLIEAIAYSGNDCG